MTSIIMKRRELVRVVLLMISAISGLIHLEIIPGVDFVFGSIVTVVLIMLYGPRWGVIGAIVSGIFTIFLWHQPYAFIIFTFEAALIGYLYHRTKKNIVLIDYLFWLIIGLPLVMFLYKGFLGLSWPAVKLIFLKQSLNGIFNSLVGCLIVYLSYLHSGHKIEGSKIRYSNLIYNVIMLFVLIPVLGFVVFHGQSKYDDFQKSAKQNMEIMVNDVTQDIDLWFNFHMTPLKELAGEISTKGLSRNEIQNNLDLLNRALPELYTVYVADENGKTIAFAPQVNEYGESTIGLDFSDREYYRLVKERKQPVISDVFLGRGGVFQPIVTFNVPILEDNRFAGFVNGSINLSSLTEVLEGIAKEEVDICILDSQRQIIASTEYQPLEVHTIFPEYNKEAVDNNLYFLTRPDMKSKLSMLEKSLYVYINQNFLDQTSIGHTLIIQMPLAPIYKAVYEELGDTLSLALAVLLLVIIFGHLASRGLVKTLQKIADEADYLPAKITLDQPAYPATEWPRSNIYEVNTLVKTFKIVEQKLAESFSEIKSNEAKFSYLAHHDSLTGLPNQPHFIKLVSELIQSSREMQAIMFIDVEGLKNVSDTLGHYDRDMILIQVSERLKDLLDKGDFLARKGGDEFLLYSRTKTLEEVKSRAEYIVNQLTEPYDIGEWRFYLKVIIGISIYPLHGEATELLIKYADMAMYAAKETGRNNFFIFEESLMLRVKKKAEMEKRLRDALHNNEFQLHYQPIFDTKKQKVMGTEALLRWINPESNTTISPLEFIPLAEETGIIIPLGEWVMKTAARQTKQWQRVTGLPLSISINVSVIQFMDDNFVNVVSQALKESGLESKYLTLEITESNVMQNLDLALKKMEELKKLGVKLALDDFGTGYSSLSYLKDFPLDVLKIDRSFISALVTNQHSKALVNAVINVAHTLNLVIIAEGVERAEQLKELKEMHCDYIQGFLLSRPMTTDQIEELLNGM